MYDTLLPLFSGAHSNAVPNEVVIQPMQVSSNGEDQTISDVGVQEALDEERTEIEESRSMPKWLVQTLRDSKLCLVVFAQVLIVLILHQILLLFQTCVMKRNLYLLMRHTV